MQSSNELNELIDKNVAHGYDKVELLTDLSNAILLTYYRKYPNSPVDAEVLIDQNWGNIRIMSGKSDVTPEDFDSLVEMTAKNFLLNRLLKNTNKPNYSLQWIWRIVFWGYNLFFLIAAVITMFSIVPKSFTNTDWLKSIDWFQGIVVVVLLLTPITSMVVATRKKDDGLGNIFFGFEVPTIIISWILLSIFLNPIAPIKLFALLALSLPAMLLFNLRLGKYLGIIYLLATSYLTIIWTFWVPVILGFWFSEVIRNMVGGYIPPFWIIMSVPLTLLLLGLIVVPYLLSISLARNWWTLMITKKNYILNSILGCGFVCVLAIISYQPGNNKLINQLERFQETSKFEEKEQIVSQLISSETQIKQMLTDIYNAGGRYPIVKGQSGLGNMYQNSLNIDENVANSIENLYEMVAFPFVYRGPTNQGGNLVSAYEEIFGKTFYPSYYGNAESKQVEIDQRTVEIKTDYEGLIATVSITDEFNNLNNWSQQEVIYEFSLPNESVVTELKLGTNLEFDGVIAPKGAAVKTYQTEVNRRKDPALLEQVGPRQYRLRVFPIPTTKEVLVSGKQKVKFSYIVAADKNGFSLPVYSKLTNLKNKNSNLILATMDGKDVTLNGDSKIVAEGKNVKDWGCNENNRLSLKTKYDQFKAEIIAFGCKEIAQNITGKKIAILYDVSYDNKDSLWDKKLKDFVGSNKDLIKNNQISYYRFNDKISQPKLIIGRQSLDEPVYFGKSDVDGSLKAIDQRYDTVIVLTGEKTIATSLKNIGKDFTAQVYMVHKSEKIPSYDQEFAYRIVRNGGQVVESIDEAFNHMANSSINNSNFTGKFWRINSTGSNAFESIVTKNDDPFNYILAKGLLDKKVTEIGSIDVRYEFAKRNGMVTAYSSLIALVNDAQRQNLEINSQSNDKFEEIEPQGQWNNTNIMLRPNGGGFSSLQNLSVPSFDSGVNIMSVNSSPSFNFVGMGIFVAINLIFIGMGMVWYLVRKFRSRRQLQGN